MSGRRRTYKEDRWANLGPVDDSGGKIDHGWLAAPAGTRHERLPRAMM